MKQILLQKTKILFLFVKNYQFNQFCFVKILRSICLIILWFIYKPNDEKVQITKIKKQAGEKRIYNVNDYVVYPKHGVGKIIAVEKAKMGGIEITFYKVHVDREKLSLSIPLNQQSHLRPISTINQINKAISILKGKPKIKIYVNPYSWSYISKLTFEFLEGLRGKM